MKRVETGHDDILVYREPYYWTYIFTVPFYAAAVSFGGYYGLWALQAVFSKPVGGGWAGLVALGIAGLLAFSAIAWAIYTPFDWFGRRRCEIDRRAGTVTVTWGMLGVPLYCRTESLASFDTVSIHGWREVGCDTGAIYRTEYYLDLKGDYVADLRLGRAETPERLEAMSDDIALFVGWRTEEPVRSDYLDWLAQFLADRPEEEQESEPVEAALAAETWH